MSGKSLTARGAAHLLVDAVCASSVMRTPELVMVFSLYNTCAFSTQCLIGLVTDFCGPCRYLAPLSCVWVAVCAFLPMPPLVRAVLIGLGNSLFHVSAGSEVLRSAGDKAAPLGLFVAPGALGVCLGKMFPAYYAALGVLLLLCAVWLAAEGRAQGAPSDRPHESQNARSLAPALLLLLAVAVRAAGGAPVGSPGQSTFWMPLLTALAVFLGKSAGGLVSDRIGIPKTVWISLLPAAVMTLFGSGNTAAGMLGQFFLNFTMPITLFLLYRCLPDSPGFSFGLTASVLWPGMLLGQIICASGGKRNLLMLLCFVTAFISILYAERSCSHEKSR